MRIVGWKGLFVGTQDFFDEVSIGIRDGVIKARLEKRLDGVQRIDAELVAEMRLTPWDCATWTSSVRTWHAHGWRARAGSQKLVRETWRH